MCKDCTEHQTRILLFGEMGTIGHDVHCSLASHGLDVTVIPFRQNVFNDEAGYWRELAKAIREHQPKIVFPVGHSLAMSRFKELVGQGVPLGKIINSRKTFPEWEKAVEDAIYVVETEDKIRILDSKVQFYALVQQLGLRQPDSYGSLSEIPEGVRPVFKRDISFGGHGVHLPRNMEALLQLIAHQSPGEPYLIEKFIEGEDYSIDVVRSGESFYSGGYRCLQSQCNGPATIREILSGNTPILEQMREYAKIILEHLDYQGVCGFDFRAAPDGNVYIMECNPRFTGGIAAQIASGFDIPWLLYINSIIRPSALTNMSG